MKFLLIAIVLTIAVGVEADKRCNGGPNYFCANVTIAELCNRTEHCQHNVWKVNEDEKNVGQGLVKQICACMDDMENRGLGVSIGQIVIGSLTTVLFGNILKGGSFKESTRNVMESFCSLIPCGYEYRCVNAVGIFFTDHELPNQRRVNLPEEDMCEVCRMFAEVLKPYMDTKPNMEVKSILLMMCDLNIVPVLNCNEQVENYFGMGWIVLKQMLDSGDVCDVVQICQSPSNNKDGMCNMCNMATNIMKPHMDGSKSSQNDAKDSLNMFCTMMPQKLGQNCTALVESYFDKAWNLINNINPDEICTVLGVCKSPTIYPLKRTLQMQALQMEKLDVAIYFMKSFMGNMLNVLNSYHDLMNSIKDKEIFALCEGCQFVVDLTKPYIGYKEEIKSALQSWCTIYSHIFEIECSFVLSNYDVGYAAIKPTIESEELCTELKMCTASTMTTLLKKEIKDN